MLDTMQLTAIMTDPTPRTVPPEHGGANELLGVVKSDGEFKRSVGWLSAPRRPFGSRTPTDCRASEPLRARLALAIGSLALIIAGLVAGTMIATTSATPPQTSHTRVSAPWPTDSS